jgi:hypothetical protein
MRSFDTRSRWLTRDKLPASQAPAGGSAAASGAERARGLGAGAEATQRRLREAIARAGLLGFVFFLVKGLFWLAVPYVLFLIGTSN